MALVVKNLPANARDTWDAGSIPGSGRSPGGGHGNPFQYSCLENPIDRGAWQATVHGVAESDMTEQLSLTGIKKIWELYEVGHLVVQVGKLRHTVRQPVSHCELGLSWHLLGTAGLTAPPAASPDPFPTPATTSVVLRVLLLGAHLSMSSMLSVMVES